MCHVCVYIVAVYLVYKVYVVCGETCFFFFTETESESKVYQKVIQFECNINKRESQCVLSNHICDMQSS